MLWFAWKFVPLWYQQQPYYVFPISVAGCDLLENSYLCGINNNYMRSLNAFCSVVICLKIRTFVVSTTTKRINRTQRIMLWFAWKFVPLWYQQQRASPARDSGTCCDLLENSYLCGINNNSFLISSACSTVVICLKIRTFVVSTTTQGDSLDA